MAGSARIAKHVHAPLQSGSDAVLRRMRRKYRPRHYADRIRKARERMPEAAIGADVMTGFPGETDDEFEESRDSSRVCRSLICTCSLIRSGRARRRPRCRDKCRCASASGATGCCGRWARRRTSRSGGGLIGKRLSAVTIEDGGVALSSNYVKIRLAAPAVLPAGPPALQAWRPALQHPANRLIDVAITGLGEGLGEVLGDVVDGFDAHGEAH